MSESAMNCLESKYSRNPPSSISLINAPMRFSPTIAFSKGRNNTAEYYEISNREMDNDIKTGEV